MKYIRKGVREDFAIGRVDKDYVKENTFTVKDVTKDTTIETKYGEALITKGNYIMTDFEGNKVGTTFSDLQSQFEEV